MTIWIWFLVVTLVVALTIYILSGGADFGAGVWYFFGRGEQKKAQRQLIDDAIAPIWEANHVWMILVIVILFVAFPRSFSVLMTALHIPMTLMLIGIVLRGSSFVFRAYGKGSEREVSSWGGIFSVSSALTPLLLGVILGATSSSRIVVDPAASRFVSSQISDFWTAWLHPYAWSVGALVMMLCVYLSAVYLVIDAPTDALKATFRRRSIISGVILAPLAGVALWLSKSGAPLIYEGLTHGALALGLHGLTACFALTTLALVYKKRDQLARLSAIAQVILIVVGWAMAQYPYIVPPSLTFEHAAAPEQVLRPMVFALIIGSMVMLPSMAYLYHVFKRPLEVDSNIEASHD